MSAPDPRLANLERTMRRSFTELRANLCEAYDRHDWKTTGYSSWEAYLAAEFGPFAKDAARIVVESKR